MKSYITAINVVLGVAGFAQAQAPSGIFPQASSTLAVNFGRTQVLPGTVMPMSAVRSMPTIGVANPQFFDNNQRYVFVMIDLDANDGGTSIENIGGRSEAPSNNVQQPTDSTHRNGQDTYLQCMLQDMTFSSTNDTFGSGATQLEANTNGPAFYVAPNPSGSSSSGHRYLEMLFQQPANFQIPDDIQKMIESRKNFDMRQFIQECNLPLPDWENWFFVPDNGESALSAAFSTGVTTITSATVSTETTTVTSTFISDGIVETETRVERSRTTSTLTTTSSYTLEEAAPTSGDFLSLTTITTTFTEPNGGPTDTFVSVSTETFPNDGNGAAASSTFLTTSTSIFTTTKTYDNGRSTRTFLTTSRTTETETNSSDDSAAASSTTYILTTGFTGFSTVTTTSDTTFETTTTLGDGEVSAGLTTSSSTLTETFSGFTGSLSVSTYSTTFVQTTTGTRTLPDGETTTFTSTSTSFGLTTSTSPPSSTNAAAIMEKAHMIEKAALGVAGIALLVL